MNGWPFTVTVPVEVAVGGAAAVPPRRGRRRAAAAASAAASRRPGLPGIGGAPAMTKLPGQVENARDVIPLWAKLAYSLCPGRSSIVTFPPAAGVITPTWAAAVQTELSSV